METIISVTVNTASCRWCGIQSRWVWGLVALCREKLGWKKSTTYTVLKSWESGDCAKRGKRGDCTGAPGDGDGGGRRGICGQNVQRLIAWLSHAFMSGRKLTEREAEDLKRLIDQYQEG